MPGTKSSDRRRRYDVPGRHYATGQADPPEIGNYFPQSAYSWNKRATQSLSVKVSLVGKP